jgi:hypothetical protein
VYNLESIYVIEDIDGIYICDPLDGGSLLISDEDLPELYEIIRNRLLTKY